MAVGCGDDDAGGEYFQSRVGAVPFVLVVHEAEAELAWCAAGQVGVGADPGNPIALGRALRIGVAEGDEEAAIAEVFGCVAIAGQRGRERAGGCPGRGLIIGEHEVRVLHASVFAKEDGELPAVR